MVRMVWEFRMGVGGLEEAIRWVVVEEEIAWGRRVPRIRVSAV